MKKLNIRRVLKNVSIKHKLIQPQVVEEVREETPTQNMISEENKVIVETKEEEVPQTPKKPTTKKKVDTND